MKGKELIRKTLPWALGATIIAQPVGGLLQGIARDYNTYQAANEQLNKLSHEDLIEPPKDILDKDSDKIGQVQQIIFNSSFIQRNQPKLKSHFFATNPLHRKLVDGRSGAFYRLPEYDIDIDTRTYSSAPDYVEAGGIQGYVNARGEIIKYKSNNQITDRMLPQLAQDIFRVPENCIWQTNTTSHGDTYMSCNTAFHSFSLYKDGYFSAGFGV